MTQLLEITEGDVFRLNDGQLHRLLKLLLFLETKKFEIDVEHLSVSPTLRQQDGGEDGRVIWDHHSLEKTEFLPCKDTFFQCKRRENASEFAETACKDEMIYEDKEGKIVIKESIDDLFSNDGVYILFCNFTCSPKMKNTRIKGFRAGLHQAGAEYASRCIIKIYDGEKISDWVNKFTSAVIFVCECIGRSTPIGAKTWNDWSSYPENLNQFYSDGGVIEKITAIRNHLSSKQKVARIVGLSGLGKSRLALEAFRPPINYEDEPSQFRLSQNIVYIDARDDRDIVAKVSHWRQNGLSGILVVDECDCKLHERLSREIKHNGSNLSLLTIDFSDDCGTREDPIIRCEPLDDEIIEKIISEQFPKMDNLDVQRIVEISQGFPQMAVLIAQDRKLGAETIGTLTKGILVDRLIGGRDSPSELHKKVISACSLFSAFRSKGEKPLHTDYIAQKICNLEKNEFSRTLNEIKNSRGIIEERGRYLRVTPKPLAITLATNWWKNCSMTEAEELINGADIPEELVPYLCEQFKFLSLESEIQQLTIELCGDQGPFGQAKILNSERGSQIFRSIAEVNPSAAVDTLARCFGNVDKEALMDVGPGRRNLIWTLEKLCFWKEHFQKAAHLMLKFAVSETEHGLGNNATGQFCRLYHYLLSGTQAPPEMRLAVIDRGLDTDDPDYQRICIIALGHALKTQHFHRIGGVETQGCRYPHEDWQPTIYKELFDYWDGALQRLERYSVKDDELGDLARKQIQDSIIGMLRYGRLDTLEKIILSICDKRGIFWPEAQYDMKWFLSNYNDKIPAEGKERINELIKKLEPKNTKEKIYVTIIRPGLTVRFEGEDWHEKRIGNVEELARELAKNPNELLEALNILYQTQAVYGRHFGYTLGKYYEDKLKFINNSLTLLESIPKELRNETILGGFLFALRPNNPELIKYCLENIGDNPNLEDLLIPLTSYSQPDKADLERLLAPLKSGKLCIDDFKTFQYSAVLSHLSPSIVTSFLADILSISPEGCSVVLDIIYTYTFKDTAKLQECIPFIKNMLIEKRCFYYSIKTSPTHYNLYTIDEITVSLLQADKNNEDLVEKFTKELVSLCSEGLNTHGIADNLQDLLELLISPDYINLTWPIFGKAIVEDETSDIAYCLMDLLGNKFSLGDGKKSILESIPIQITSRWCEENPEHAPNFLSLAISPLTEEDGCVCWSPYAVYLLDNFGTSEHILSNLSRNIHTFPWRGSLVPAYEKRLQAFSQLINHKNSKVKQWAEKNIDELTRIIKTEKERDAEEELYK